MSNHGHVPVALATDPVLVLREVAEHVDTTARAVQQIVGDLEAAGYLTRAGAPGSLDAGRTWPRLAGNRRRARGDGTSLLGEVRPGSRPDDRLGQG